VSAQSVNIFNGMLDRYWPDYCFTLEPEDFLYRQEALEKMLGPFATASRRTPIHQLSLLSHARIDVHDNNDNDNA